ATVAPLLKAIDDDEYETTKMNAIVGLRERKFESASRGLTRVLKEEHLKDEEDLSPSLFGQVSFSLVKDGGMVGDDVLTALSHKEARIRDEALNILGTVGASQATDQAIQMLENDGDANVRESAAVALGRFKQHRAVDPLLRVVANEKEWHRVRSAALGALSAKRALEAKDAFVAALASPYVSFRATGASGLGNLRAASAAPTLIQMAKNRTEPDSVREAAIGALAEIGGIDAEQCLLELLSRERGAVRSAVVSAVGATKTRDAVPSLIAILDNRGEDESLRRAAASSLSEIGDPRAGTSIAQRLLDPTERRIGYAGADEHYFMWESLNDAARSFRMPPELLPYLEQWVWDDWHSIHVRRQSPHAIGAIADPRASEVLVRLLDENGDLHIRRLAVRSMGVTGNTSLVPKLIPLLKDARSVEERRDVPLTLGELGDPSAIQPLIEMMNTDGDEAARKSAETALAKFEQVDALAARLKTDGVPVGELIHLLGRLEELGTKASSAMSAVESLKTHDRADVRFAAHAAAAAISQTTLDGV
ncbi:MAG: HEAT repeat domain-containing protein, partial [Candidatus Poribacteria bacterium]|nr:HEAT repeat domain-containing protein [Candidatus Poribacteria bacterium]